MIRAIFYFLLTISFVSCGEDDTLPKPRGYYRIDFPEKKYQQLAIDCPFTFEYPTYAKIQTEGGRNNEKCWLNVDFGKLKAKVHMSFKELDNNVVQYQEESRKMAFKHSVKASGIGERPIENKSEKVYGILYEIGGNAASSIQFHVTDSTRYFLRGSLYFYAEPNADSLAPSLNFIQKDITHLIETFKWK
jgi:gliding motility-associated lipoprotein GldD